MSLIYEEIERVALLGSTPTVDEMTNYILKHLMKGFGFKAKEIGPYNGDTRFDVFGIKRYTREIRIFEVKSCRQDFTSDKKWKNYLPYCTHFAFVTPRGVINPDELPKGIGLVEFWNEEHKNYKNESYWTLQYEYARGCKRLQDKVDDEHYIPLLEGIIMRLMSECDEFKNYWLINKEIEKISQGVWKLLRIAKGE